VSRSQRKPGGARVLVADIGSTITKLSAFDGMNGTEAFPRGGRVRFLGQGTALTTVAEGDVGIGLDAARMDLEKSHGVDISEALLMAASSAAGGLRMTVHGLTQDMTLRAAREASLGAGAIVTFTTAGLMTRDDLDEIRRIRPNIILLAGGVDYGDRRVVVENAGSLASLEQAVPVIYAGNRAARGEVRRILEGAGMPLFVVDNVYPRIDELNIDPVRKVIQEVFARHIITAPGMEKVKEKVHGPIVPTPGAVMAATELLARVMEDVMTVDVGGATTDVHSVTEGSPEYVRKSVAPEPRSKRTVEGDLGVYVNAAHIVSAAGDALGPVKEVMPVPDTEEARQVSVKLARWAVDLSIWRHAGEVRVAYGAQGPSELVEGRDLTAIKTVIGTGGALTRLGMGDTLLKDLRTDPRARKLLPPRDANVLLDRDYIMAAAGVLARQFPEAAESLLLESLGVAGRSSFGAEPDG
jgi:hypothetical protein